MLALADIRQGIIERPGIGARPVLGRGIIRLLETQEQLVEGKLFGRFMVHVNLMGAGIAFEVWDDAKIDQFMARCLEQAESEMSEAAHP
jgi:hypothetical protein